jgi:hypothetical protein
MRESRPVYFVRAACVPPCLDPLLRAVSANSAVSATKLANAAKLGYSIRVS